MKKYNIDSFSKEDIFGGKIIVPYRQWLKTHQIETKNYDYNADLAIITHYLQNMNNPEGIVYRKEALPLIERFYRATHTDLKDDEVINQERMLALFSAVNDTPVYKKFRDNNDFTFVDLFAGIGGFRIALEKLGGRCVYASEFDKSAQKTYGYNHGVVPFGDITQQINKDYIPYGIDVLCAGFPCQPFSLAGKRQGFADEKKGTLFYDLKDIIETKQPKTILLENVQGLLSIHNRDGEGKIIQEKTINTILYILREVLHYHVPEPKVLNARNFGVPQYRNRVFIVGFWEQPREDFFYPTGEGFPDVHFGQIRERSIVATRYYMSERYWQTLVRHKESQRNQGRGYGYRIIGDDDYGHTLMVGGMGLERNLVRDMSNLDVNNVDDPRGELNHDHIRVLTERECARMQGFPDYFEISNGKTTAYKQFGNSVAIPVVKEVARSLLSSANINFRNVE